MHKDTEDNHISQCRKVAATIVLRTYKREGLFLVEKLADVKAFAKKKKMRKSGESS